MLLPRLYRHQHLRRATHRPPPFPPHPHLCSLQLQEANPNLQGTDTGVIIQPGTRIAIPPFSDSCGDGAQHEGAAACRHQPACAACRACRRPACSALLWCMAAGLADACRPAGAAAQFHLSFLPRSNLKP